MQATNIVPMISSGVAGPLGALHLPRLWLKVSLEATGQLAPGYPGIGPGFDMMTITALGLDADAVRAYITNSKPTYPLFEAWVRTNGTKLTPADIHKHNIAILGYVHTDETRKSILEANDTIDNGGVLPDAVNLNNLDDWFEFHRQMLKCTNISEDAAGGA